MGFGKWLMGEIDWKANLDLLKAIFLAIVVTFFLMVYVWYMAVYFCEFFYVNKVHNFVAFIIIVLLAVFPFVLVSSLFYIRKKYKIYKNLKEG